LKECLEDENSKDISIEENYKIITEEDYNDKVLEKISWKLNFHRIQGKGFCFTNQYLPNKMGEK